MRKKYKYWEVCDDEKETGGMICVGSIWGQEWWTLNIVVAELPESEIKAMLLRDINTYEIQHCTNVDRRQVAGALAELRKISKEYA